MVRWNPEVDRIVIMSAIVIVKKKCNKNYNIYCNTKMPSNNTTNLKRSDYLLLVGTPKEYRVMVP